MQKTGRLTNFGTRPAQTWRRLYWSIALAAALLPLAAMPFTNEVEWGPEDFLFAALLLGGTGAAFEIVCLISRDRRVVLLAAVGLPVLLLTTWAHLAVGIF